jgi:hypothetical protein
MAVTGCSRCCCCYETGNRVAQATGLFKLWVRGSDASDQRHGQKHGQTRSQVLWLRGSSSVGAAGAEAGVVMGRSRYRKESLWVMLLKMSPIPVPVLHIPICDTCA